MSLKLYSVEKNTCFISCFIQWNSDNWERLSKRGREKRESEKVCVAFVFKLKYLLVNIYWVVKYIFFAYGTLYSGKCINRA